jgi:hypothetical protein
MLRLKSAPSVAVSYQHVSDSVYVYVHGFNHPQAFCMRGDDDVTDTGIWDYTDQCDRINDGELLAADRLIGV